jgi:hypothetical protein
VPVGMRWKQPPSAMMKPEHQRLRSRRHTSHGSAPLR